MARLHELRSAAPPLHRVERVIERQAQEEGGDQLRVLTALRPELGWPRAWAWLPVREDAKAGRYVPLDPLKPLSQQVQLQPFESQPGEPGAALRSSLPARWLPAEAGSGLLCLFVYADEREQRVEGLHETPDLETALRSALAAGLVALRHAFVTRPAEAPEEGKLSFVLAACQFPPGLLDTLQGAEIDPRRAGPADASLARLLAFTRGHPAGAAVSLLLLAGDQIYGDASGGVADAANSVDRYAMPYRAFKAGLVRHLPSTLERIVHAPDDHEIIDNWEPKLLADGRWDRGPWAEEALAAAWAARWEPGARAGLFERFWHPFDWRGASFFIGDSRTEREPRPLARLLRAQMISSAQRAAFAAWLAHSSAAGRPRFVLTGSMLLPRRLATAEHAASALHSDAWDGYPASLHWLLGELWRQRASNVVFLSGDEHRSGFISASIRRADGAEPERAVQLHSIHSSALYAPWPFAVTPAEALAAPEAFDFPGPEGQVLRCTVSAWHDCPGDGFALLQAEGATLRLWFDRAERPLHEGAVLPAADAVLDLS
ncbi:alkaline phosphatase D family protein [Roseateles sp.]|jgi:alkaline phosphatase D|uniref:alkaline phosphatase D family protein n=1 Tax=Roseateles sp. TaxID=1971397 RepID=UPI0037CB9A67